jgi:hypothetical protein
MPMTMRPRHYLEFDDIAGTDSEHFATFRLSGGWARRLKKGQSVFLAHTKTHCIIGTARVLSVELGRVAEMLEKHARYGHLSQASGEHPATAPSRRFESMQKRYGPHRFKHDSLMTVIYLKRST